MYKHLIPWACAWLIAGMASTARAEIQYSVLDAGSIGGAQFVQPMSLNDSAQLIATQLFFGPVNYAASFRSIAGAPVELTGPGGTRAVANAVNSAGTIVGHGYVDNHLMPSTPLLWTAGNTVAVALALPVGATTAGAASINGSGTIVGQAEFASGARAVMWSGGIATLLDQPTGYAGTRGIDIAEDGTVLGTAFVDSNNNGDFDQLNLVTWSNGVFADHGALPQGAQVRSMNAAGQVAGSGLGTFGFQALLIDLNGATPLPDLPGSSGSVAQDIDASGRVVGTSFLNGSRAVLWNQGQVYDLSELIDPTAGWTLISAGAINQAGQIAAVGLNAQFEARALLLTPVPEPGTYGLTAVGLIALATTFGYRQRRAWR